MASEDRKRPAGYGPVGAVELFSQATINQMLRERRFPNAFGYRAGFSSIAIAIPLEDIQAAGLEPKNSDGSTWRPPELAVKDLEAALKGFPRPTWQLPERAVEGSGTAKKYPIDHLYRKWEEQGRGRQA